MAKFAVLAAFVAGGAALIVFAIRLALNARALAMAPRTTGKVVRLVRSEAMPGDDGPTFAPEVAFEWEGRPHVFTSAYASSPPTSHVGETVQVAVPAGDPANADIADVRGAHATPILLSVLGVGLVLAPLVVVLFDSAHPRVPAGAGMLMLVGVLLLAGGVFIGAVAPDPANFRECDGQVQPPRRLVNPRFMQIAGWLALAGGVAMLF